MQDASFQQARAKSKQAEDAAALAHANADKAIKLLKVSEESSRQVDEFRKEHELRLKKLEELAATVGPSSPHSPFCKQRRIFTRWNIGNDKQRRPSKWCSGHKEFLGLATTKYE